MRSFESFFMGGFECSAHRRKDGTRLDLQAATEHDRLAAADFRALARAGILTYRDGLRWHAIETSPGKYEWQNAAGVLQAAGDLQADIIWDLCHYGWPDWLDVWSDEFPRHFAAFAAAAAEHIIGHNLKPTFCLINEISFLAWAAGEAGQFFPGNRRRGLELKTQLCKAAIVAARAIRGVVPNAIFVTAEPLIHVMTHAGKNKVAAAAHHASQYQAVDILLGRREPELGGGDDLVDVVGLNYYPGNQWYLNGSTIPLGHYDYRPLRVMLREVHERTGKPLFIAETGAEGTGRSSWLHYVCSEVNAAIAEGIPILGICIYPILDYPGWENGRHCDVGLLSVPSQDGKRTLNDEFAAELFAQQRKLAADPPLKFRSAL